MQRLQLGFIRRRMSAKRSRISITLALAGAAFACSLYPIGILAAETLLVVRQTPAPSDIIVFLGEDGAPRAARAAQLSHQGIAPRVLAVGIDDCKFIKVRMIEAGVDPSVFVEECKSITTWDNARFATPILKALGVHSAVLVTSWFHSRRALKSFSLQLPFIRWTSVPAETVKSARLLIDEFGNVQMFKEYLKALFYDLRTLFCHGGALGQSAALKAAVDLQTATFPIGYRKESGNAIEI